MPLEDGPQQVVFSRAWRVDREPLLRSCPLCVADHGLGVVSEAVDPIVAHAVAELSGKHSNQSSQGSCLVHPVKRAMVVVST